MTSKTRLARLEKLINPQGDKSLIVLQQDLENPDLYHIGVNGLEVLTEAEAIKQYPEINYSIIWVTYIREPIPGELT